MDERGDREERTNSDKKVALDENSNLILGEIDEASLSRPNSCNVESTVINSSDRPANIPTENGDCTRIELSNQATLSVNEDCVDDILPTTIDLHITINAKNMKEDSPSHVKEQTPIIFKKLAIKTCKNIIVPKEIEIIQISESSSSLPQCSNDEGHLPISYSENSLVLDGREDFIVERLLSVGNEVLPYFENRLNCLVESVAGDPWELFKSVAERIFHDRSRVNWGQIIVLLYFGISLVRRFIYSHDGIIVNNVIRCIMRYFSLNNIFTWIAENGGWYALENICNRDNVLSVISVCTIPAIIIFCLTLYRYFRSK